MLAQMRINKEMFILHKSFHYFFPTPLLEYLQIKFRKPWLIDEAHCVFRFTKFLDFFPEHVIAFKNTTE